MAEISQNAFKAVPRMGLAVEHARPLARWVITIFMLSMIIPIWIRVGSVLLMPHRVVLLLLFVPLFFVLFLGRAGRIRFFDILMLSSSLWALLSLVTNGTVLGASIPQQMGVYMLESFGAYMLARVTIRTAADFAFFTKAFFGALLVLVPFGVLESITHRPIILEIIPQSVEINWQRARWGLRRAQTVFAHPILFGVFCSAGFGLFWYAMRSKLTRVGGTFMAFAGTFVSLSSGALLSMVIQSAFMIWNATMKGVPYRWRIFTGLGVLGYVVVDLLSNRNPFHVLVTYGTFNSGNSYNRILIWNYGIENVRANPLFGLGADIALWERPIWMSSSADNYWLLLAMQFGIPCFAFLVTALFILLRRICLADLRDSYAQGARAGYLTAIGGLILAGGTVHYWHGVMAFFMFLLGAGAWMTSPAEDSDAVAEPDTPKARDQNTPARQTYTRQTDRHTRARPTPAREHRSRADTHKKSG